MNLSVDPVGALVAIVLAYTAALLWLFRVQSVAHSARDGVERIEESRKADKIAYDAWITSIAKDASDYKAEISRLTESIDGLGERIAERASADQRFYTQRFDDIERRIDTAARNATVARDTARRAKTDKPSP